jgi:cytoskeleton protein RodZ
MDEIEKEASVNSNNPQTSGEILSKKRKDTGLSLESVAEKLNLDPKLIELLEKNEYESFKFETYLKGYLRAYSKFLDIDGDMIINLYKENNPEKQPEILPDVKPKIQKNSNDKSVKLFTYIIGLSFALSILIWYQKNFLIEPNKEITKIVSSIPDISNKINGVDISYKIITHSDYWQWPIDNIIKKYKQDDDTNNFDLIKNKDTRDATAEDKKQTEIKDITKTEESPVYEKQNASDTVVLTLTGDSWIEIYDRDGNRLFLDLARSGKNYIVNGNSPFDILLGAANEVSVEFNGSAFNTEPYIKYGIARFTLPME